MTDKPTPLDPTTEYITIDGDKLERFDEGGITMFRQMYHTGSIDEPILTVRMLYSNATEGVNGVEKVAISLDTRRARVGDNLPTSIPANIVLTKEALADFIRSLQVYLPPAVDAPANDNVSRAVGEEGKS